MADIAEDTIDRSSFSSSGYEVPQFTGQQREGRNEESLNKVGGEEDLCYTAPIPKPRALKAVSSTASHQSQFLSKSSGLQLLGLHTSGNGRPVSKKRNALLCNVLCLVAVCSIILVGIIALVLGAVTMKGSVCRGDVSCKSRTEAEPGEMIRQLFTSLQKQIQDLKSTVTNNNLTTISAIVNTTRVYEGCRTNTSECTVLPVPRDFDPANPVCTTRRLRINNGDVRFIAVHGCLLIIRQGKQ